MPPGIKRLIQWISRWRSIEKEIEDFQRQMRQDSLIYDQYVPNFARYFVRFPFLIESEFSKWEIITDQDLGLGYSWGEFVRSPKSAAGYAEPIGPDVQKPAQREQNMPTFSEDEDDSHLYAYTYPNANPTLFPSPGGKNAARSAIAVGALDVKFQGYGLFRGFLSTRVPDRGDLVRAGFVNLRGPDCVNFGSIIPYMISHCTHIVIRYRGDGRSYRINLVQIHDWQEYENDIHHFILYTRGGPYWQTAKIPISKFFVLTSGCIRTNQYKLHLHNLRTISFTLMDGVDGPFCLEIDYIMFFMDPVQTEKFAYEQYDRTGAISL